ncbi:MAG: 4Fe-4S dicluster domain-containing protein [Victivallaceae bacterium]|nr:4Fe-4S dicluster domain-containing protein [Victivallaceae bacterium]
MTGYTPLKILRIISSLAALVILPGIFLLPKNFPAAAAHWQFIPAGLRTMAVFSLAMLGVFGFSVLLAVIFGRVYCSFFCPLGTFQDVVIRLTKIIGRSRKKGVFTPNRRRWRYSLAAGLLGALLFGTALPLGLFEPFAIFGRFTAAIFKPGFNYLNNLLADQALIAGLYPRENSPFSPALLVIGGGAMLAVAAAAARRGRIFCNTICPAGALLGLFSKISRLKITLDSNKCVKCGQCAAVCKANCIDYATGRVDNERCVVCFNCTAVCGFNAVRYTHRQAAPPAAPDFSRRDFLMIGSSAVAGAVLLPGLLRRTVPAAAAVMPPGALTFDRFTASCTGCQLCVSNCPGRVLKPAALEYGLGGFLQPRLDFDAGKCEYECTACSRICPNGALLPLTVGRKQRLQIGRAQYHRERCVVVTDRTHCGACAEHCPTGAIRMADWKDGLTIPKLKPELCIGCGACEYICPVRPDKAITVSGLQTQGTAQFRRGKPAVNRVENKDFPF